MDGHEFAIPVGNCQTCNDWTPRTSLPVRNASVNEVKRSQVLATEYAPNIQRITDGAIRRFNPSIITVGGNLVLAYRDFEVKSQILLSINGCSPMPLVINDRRCAQAHEDPRLFEHNGEIFCAFAGVGARGVRIYYGKVEWPNGHKANPVIKELHMPEFNGRRQATEKNWSFFSKGGKLYCIYSITPHIILEVDGPKATVAYQQALMHTYEPYGVLHGGCVVMVDNQPWHFFHSYVNGTSDHPGRIYNYSVYALDENFKVVNWVKRPLYIADVKTKPQGYLHSVTFPGGGIITGSANNKSILLACGAHDQWCELHSWPLTRLREVLHA